MLKRTENLGPDDWRTIRCADVQWDLIPGTRRAVTRRLAIQCSPPTEYVRKHEPDAERWDDLTLGQLADRGERWWIRHGDHFGTIAVEVIKTIIDAAAAGYDVTRMKDAYVPKSYEPRPWTPGGSGKKLTQAEPETPEAIDGYEQS